MNSGLICSESWEAFSLLVIDYEMRTTENLPSSVVLWHAKEFRNRAVPFYPGASKWRNFCGSMAE